MREKADYGEIVSYQSVEGMLRIQHMNRSYKSLESCRIHCGIPSFPYIEICVPTTDMERFKQFVDELHKQLFEASGEE